MVLSLAIRQGVERDGAGIVMDFRSETSVDARLVANPAQGGLWGDTATTVPPSPG